MIAVDIAFSAARVPALRRVPGGLRASIPPTSTWFRVQGLKFREFSVGGLTLC